MRFNTEDTYTHEEIEEYLSYAAADYPRFIRVGGYIITADGKVRYWGEGKTPQQAQAAFWDSKTGKIGGVPIVVFDDDSVMTRKTKLA